MNELRPFKVTDLKRAIRGALAEGMPIEGARIRSDGTIELLFVSDDAPVTKNEWDNET